MCTNAFVLPLPLNDSSWPRLPGRSLPNFAFSCRSEYLNGEKRREANIEFG